MASATAAMISGSSVGTLEGVMPAASNVTTEMPELMALPVASRGALTCAGA